MAQNRNPQKQKAKCRTAYAKDLGGLRALLKGMPCTPSIHWTKVILGIDKPDCTVVQ